MGFLWSGAGSHGTLNPVSIAPGSQSDLTMYTEAERELIIGR